MATFILSGVYNVVQMFRRNHVRKHGRPHVCPDKQLNSVGQSAVTLRDKLISGLERDKSVKTRV